MYVSQEPLAAYFSVFPPSVIIVASRACLLPPLRLKKVSLVLPHKGKNKGTRSFLW